MDYLQLKDAALLIGFSPEGDCVYSASMALGDFWKVEHVWDCPDEVCRMRLQRVHGYLFGNSGELTQEFVNVFDLATGYYMSGWARLIDGTYRQDAI